MLQEFQSYCRNVIASLTFSKPVKYPLFLAKQDTAAGEGMSQFKGSASFTYSSIAWLCGTDKLIR